MLLSPALCLFLVPVPCLAPQPAALLLQDQAGAEREAAAAQAWGALPEPEPAPRTTAEREPWYRRRVAVMEAFAKEWRGTLTAMQAVHFIGMSRARVFGDPGGAADSLGEVFQALTTRRADLDSIKGEHGFALDYYRVAMDYTKALSEAGRFDECERVLKELVKEESSEQARLQRLLDELPILRETRIGAPLPAFQGVDLDGDEVRPGQFKGKVLLIDFWATWCGPCIREMPSVVEAYGKYHDQGFEILGISMDYKVTKESQAEAQASGQRVRPLFDEETLRTKLAEHKMTWRQVYDGGGWGAALGKRFAIHSIPATILIDRQGIIRHKKLRGEKLLEAVAELLAEK